jgi:hypothetical protein
MSVKRTEKGFKKFADAEQIDILKESRRGVVKEALPK